MFTPLLQTCYMLHMMCHMSRVTCHISCVTIYIFFLRQNVGVSQWRVCYQRDLPCLVFQYIHFNTLNLEVSNYVLKISRIVRIVNIFKLYMYIDIQFVLYCSDSKCFLTGLQNPRKQQGENESSFLLWSTFILGINIYLE